MLPWTGGTCTRSFTGGSRFWRVGFRLDGRESVAAVGECLHVPPGMAHDWWNAGDEEARVIVEISPAARFEEAILNTFGLARDGKTNAKGMPNLLRVALFAREGRGRVVDGVGRAGVGLSRPPGR